MPTVVDGRIVPAATAMTDLLPPTVRARIT
jgi:hypothetical protein